MIKNKEDHIRFFYLHPAIMLILVDMYNYCYDQGLPFNITSTVSTLSEDKLLQRVSKSHRTARAADISTRNWDDLEIKDFMNHFMQKYKEQAAVNTKGENRLIVWHNSGFGDHMHIQIHSRYSKTIKRSFK